MNKQTLDMNKRNKGKGGAQRREAPVRNVVASFISMQTPTKSMNSMIKLQIIVKPVHTQYFS